MFGFKGIHHVAISVPSVEKAKAFYVEKLGFELIDSAHYTPTEIGDELMRLKDAECHIIMVKAGNLILEIFEFLAPAPEPREKPRPLNNYGYTHLAFEVEDIQRAYEHLTDAGVTWHRPPIEVGDGYIMTYGRDPFGNVIEIQQLKDGFPYSFDQLGK